MAGKTGDRHNPRGSRQPARALGFRLSPIATDDLVLAVLWVLVAAGLLLLVMLAAWSVFGWDLKTG